MKTNSPLVAGAVAFISTLVVIGSYGIADPPGGVGGSMTECTHMPDSCRTWGASNPTLPGFCCKQVEDNQTGKLCGEPGTGGTLSHTLHELFGCGLQHPISNGECEVYSNNMFCGGMALVEGCSPKACL